ncbi:hypothetical protein L4A40_27060 [Bacillus cereus]|uniref:hypothetical protein n=1 Tax=Bacillus cereus group TaxID=86661 RepID=UPI000BEC0AB0|nr:MULTISPECIES: hypothetical protein [Bacillus cereus group]MCH5476748.1 hypothetical protein [Bacillus cereus]PEF03417.1 hypothetical protein COM97_27130 [Bacillus thuringiensis]
MKEQKTWIECELRPAPADQKQFHLVELKTGKEKIVSFGNIFPLKGSKNFLNELKKDLGIKIVNQIDFYRDVRTAIKLGLM